MTCPAFKRCLLEDHGDVDWSDGSSDGSGHGIVLPRDRQVKRPNMRQVLDVWSSKFALLA